MTEKWLPSIMHIYFSIICFTSNLFMFFLFPPSKSCRKAFPMLFSFSCIECSIHLELILTYGVRYRSSHLSQYCLLNPSFLQSSFLIYWCLRTPVPAVGLSVVFRGLCQQNAVFITVVYLYFKKGFLVILFISPHTLSEFIKFCTPPPQDANGTLTNITTCL